MDRDASFVAWCWGAEFTLDDLVGHRHAEKLTVPENTLPSLMVLYYIAINTANGGLGGAFH